MKTPFFHIGRISPDPQWHMPMHSHDHVEIIVVQQGKHHVWDEQGRHFVGKRGNVFIYCPGYGHREQSDKNNPCDIIFFPFSGDLGQGIRMVKDSSGRIFALSQWLHSLYKEALKENQEIIESYFSAIIAEIRNIDTYSSEHEALHKAKQYMHEHLSEALSLQKLASSANLSRFHFSRLYKAAYGISPVAHQRLMRLNEAKTILLQTRLPLKVIADKVGFANEYHLAREFKRQFGIAPGEFRKGHA